MAPPPRRGAGTSSAPPLRRAAANASSAPPPLALGGASAALAPSTLSSGGAAARSALLPPALGRAAVGASSALPPLRSAAVGARSAPRSTMLPRGATAGARSAPTPLRRASASSAPPHLALGSGGAAARSALLPSALELRERLQHAALIRRARARDQRAVAASQRERARAEERRAADLERRAALARNRRAAAVMPHLVPGAVVGLIATATFTCLVALLVGTAVALTATGASILGRQNRRRKRGPPDRYQPEWPSPRDADADDDEESDDEDEEEEGDDDDDDGGGGGGGPDGDGGGGGGPDGPLYEEQYDDPLVRAVELDEAPADWTPISAYLAVLPTFVAVGGNADTTRARSHHFQAARRRSTKCDVDFYKLELANVRHAPRHAATSAPLTPHH